MNIQPTAPKRRITALSRLKVKIKQFYARFDVEQAHLDSLDLTQQKAIHIASVCIENKNSKLYSHPKTNNIQIELPDIFITIDNISGFFEVDSVYTNQSLPTSDKVIFSASGVMHIFSKFDKEVNERMKHNMIRKEVIVDNHLDNLIDLAENFNK